MSEIRLLETEEAFAQSHAILSQLHPGLNQADFQVQLTRMKSNGMQFVGLYQGDELCAVAGFHFGESFGWKRYIYVDDLVTSEEERSRGHGSALLGWLKVHAKELGCQQIHLDSRVTRYATHKFYLNQGLYIGGYHFLGEL